MMNSGPYFFQSGGGGGAAGSGMTGIAYATFTPTGSWTLNCTYTGGYSRIGEYMLMNVKIALAGAPNGVPNCLINLPTGFSMDTGKLIQSASASRTPLPIANASFDDANGSVYPLFLTEFDPQSIIVATYFPSTATGNSAIIRSSFSATLPVQIQTGDSVTAWAAFPIVGWRP